MSDVQTIQFEHYETWVLLAHGVDAPTPAEWEKYVAFLRKVGDEKSAFGLLVLSDGVGPDSMQRKMISGIDLRTAVVTLSRVARGIATALSWVGVNIRAFPPEQLTEVFAYLEVEGPHRRQVMERLASMRLELAGKDRYQTVEMTKPQLEKIIASSMSELRALER